MSESEHPNPLTALTLVRQLHSLRQFSGDGYGWTVCAECRQAWPCKTVEVITEAASMSEAAKR